MKETSQQIESHKTVRNQAANMLAKRVQGTPSQNSNASLKDQESEVEAPEITEHPLPKVSVKLHAAQDMKPRE